MYAGWVTVDDLKRLLAVPGPWTPDDEAVMRITVDGVNAWIARVRPDLTPPTVPAGPGPMYSAFNPAFNPAFGTLTAGSVAYGDVFWAALQIAKMNWEKRGSDTSSFNEFGLPPLVIDKNIEEWLQVGRAHPPVVA